MLFWQSRHFWQRCAEQGTAMLCCCPGGAPSPAEPDEKDDDVRTEATWQQWMLVFVLVFCDFMAGAFFNSVRASVCVAEQRRCGGTLCGASHAQPRRHRSHLRTDPLTPSPRADLLLCARLDRGPRSRRHVDGRLHHDKYRRKPRPDTHCARPSTQKIRLGHGPKRERPHHQRPARPPPTRPAIRRETAAPRTRPPRAQGGILSGLLAPWLIAIFGNARVLALGLTFDAIAFAATGLIPPYFTGTACGFSIVT